MKNRRKPRSFVTSLQLRYGLVTAAIAFAVVLVHAVATRFQLSDATEPGSDGPLLGATLATLVVVLPTAVLLGARSLSGITGPLERMREHIEGILRGEARPPLRLREGDALNGLAGPLNRLAERARTVPAPQADGPRAQASNALEDPPPALPCEPEYERVPDHLG